MASFREYKYSPSEHSPPLIQQVDVPEFLS
jgi:hypothetical protein